MVLRRTCNTIDRQLLGATESCQERMWWGDKVDLIPALGMKGLSHMSNSRDVNTNEAMTMTMMMMMMILHQVRHGRQDNHATNHVRCAETSRSKQSRRHIEATRPNTMRMLKISPEQQDDRMTTPTTNSEDNELVEALQIRFALRSRFTNGSENI
jgi:hypothetical protein